MEREGFGGLGSHSCGVWRRMASPKSAGHTIRLETQGRVDGAVQVEGCLEAEFPLLKGYQSSSLKSFN